MRIRIAAPLALLFLTASCAGREPGIAQAPAVAPAIDVTGSYDFTATRRGESRTGTLRIERAADGYTGEARIAGESSPASFRSFTLAGSTATILADVAGQEIGFELVFAGDDFTGFIYVQSEAIEVSGTRRAD